jgi:cobalt-zinc-cadmium efflux system protein
MADTAHGHGPVTDGALDGRLWASLALNVAITVAEVIGGLMAGSLALLSDAAHNLSDVAALGLAVGSRRLARRPPTPRHTFGLKRAEVIAALVNASSLVAVTAVIAREAVSRLRHPAPVDQGVMLAVAVVALVANLASVLLLRRHDEADVNVRSAFLHLAQDAVASLAVVVAALLAHTAIGQFVDPIAALLVGAGVLRSALSLAWGTIRTLLEATPDEIDLPSLVSRVGERFAPARLHHLHIWEIGPGQRVFTAHVDLGQDLDGRSIERLFGAIKVFLEAEWGVNHATLEPEVIGCGNGELLGRWDRSPLTERTASSPPTGDHSNTPHGAGEVT